MLRHNSLLVVNATARTFEFVQTNTSKRREKRSATEAPDYTLPKTRKRKSAHIFRVFSNYMRTLIDLSSGKG